MLFDYLSYVTELLPLAGRYEPLIDMCRKGIFPETTILLPHRALRARRAIAKYLRENDPQNDTPQKEHSKRMKHQLTRKIT